MNLPPPVDVLRKQIEVARDRSLEKPRKAADGTITPLLKTTGTPALNTWGVDTDTAKYVIDSTYDSPALLAESLIDAANFPVLADGDQFLLTTVVDNTPGAANLNFEAGIVIPDANDLGLQSF